MHRIDRYIAWQLVKDWTLVWIVMSAIFSLLAIVEELERIQHQYQTAEVAQYIFYTLPQRSMDLIPVIVLLGSILAFARLNKNNEIIAMRAAGMPLTHFFQAAAIPALVLIAMLYAVSEYVAAPLYQKAEVEKTVARTGRINLLRGKGLWSVSDRRFFNVRTLLHGKIPSDIYLLQFAPDGRLLNYIYSASAEPAQDREWTFLDATQKTLENGELKTRFRKQLAMGPFWSPEELPVLPLPITGMTLSGLYRYVEHLHSTNQNWQDAEQLFWQKVALPMTAGAMVLLATPIGAALRSQRGSGVGRNLAIGTGAGIGFYLLLQIIKTSSGLIGLPPAITAFIPAALVLLATGWLFSRMR